MDKEKIKDYLKSVDELEAKLTEEDKETLQWLIYGYNQCAKLLNETERQCKKQKEVIDKIFSRITLWKMEDITMESAKVLDDLLDILKEVSE